VRKTRSAGAQPASTPASSRPFRYCASANILAAKECHHELVPIGRFSTLTAISAARPNPRDHYGIESKISIGH
jgi:hypothetical protein